MISFKHPPLVEIIAEVRWAPTGQPITAVPAGSLPSQGTALLTDGAHEGFFSDLSSGSAEIGFDRSERLIPVGFPSLAHHVIHRFRGKDATSLFQAGLGVFTVNAVPPYRSWDHFRPIVESGLNVFFAAHLKHSLAPVSEIILRYVNLFDRALIDDQNAASFAERTASIGIRFPEGISNELNSPEKLDLDLHFSVALDWGAVLRVHIADAVVGGKSGVLLDTTVIVSKLNLTSREEIALLFEQAHTVTRQTFLALTKPIHDRMEPIKD